MNISRQQIGYILSLTEHKNFGKAAEACFVTQPTLSMQVKKAEETLGFPVFDRRRSPLELTAFGKKLVPVLYDMQAEYDKILRLANESRGEISEELKIGIIPTVAAYLVPKLFENRERFSGKVRWAIREMKSEELLEQLRNKKIDLAIMAGPVTEDNLHITPLYNEEILVYSAEFGKRDLITAEDLKQVRPWLLSSGNCLRTQMIHFCRLGEESGSEWNYEGGNLQMLIRMVQQYGGYTLIPEFYKKQYGLDPGMISHAVSSGQQGFPARNIIALSSHKNSKHPDLQELVYFIKLEYANREQKKFEVLSWK